METKTNPRTININKPGYLAFLIAGIYFLFKPDFGQAGVFWGLAMIFDPFNPEVPFPERPLYQKLVLLVHLGVTLTMIGLEIAGK